MTTSKGLVITLRWSKERPRLVYIRASIKEEIVGYIEVSFLPPQAIVTGFVVEEPYRCKGVGKALFEKAQELIRNDGGSHFWLIALNENERAHAFYRTFGKSLKVTKKSEWSTKFSWIL